MDRSEYEARTDLDPRGEEGEYRSVTDADVGTYTAVELTHLGRRQPNRNQLDSSSIAADAEHALFVVWAFDLAASGVTPKVGDQILDVNNVLWVIRDITERLLATRYHCLCVRVG